MEKYLSNLWIKTKLDASIRSNEKFNGRLIFNLSYHRRISSEYVNIYRSILNMIYWPIYESRILTDIWFFPKMIYWSIYVQIFHFLSDICKFLFSKFMHISVEISYKILIFSYIGQYNIISADIWLHIPIIYVFIYRQAAYIDPYM